MRVTDWQKLPGLREWRFVESVDWQPPPEFAYLDWYVVHPDSDTKITVTAHDQKHVSERVAYEFWRSRLVPHDTGRERDGVKWPNVAWYRDGKPFYVADVSFDPAKRTVLVCIGGFR